MRGLRSKGVDTADILFDCDLDKNMTNVRTQSTNHAQPLEN